MFINNDFSNGIFELRKDLMVKLKRIRIPGKIGYLNNNTQ